MDGRNIQSDIWDKIRSAILGKEYGSVEIYIEAGEVTQITERTISKLKTRSSRLKNDRLIRAVKTLRY